MYCWKRTHHEGIFFCLVILLHFAAECNEKEKGDHIPNASAIHKYTYKAAKVELAKDQR